MYLAYKFVLCALDCLYFIYLFFFNDTPTTEIYTLSLHDALPICWLLYRIADHGPISEAALARLLGITSADLKERMTEPVAAGYISVGRDGAQAGGDGAQAGGDGAQARGDGA